MGRQKKLTPAQSYVKNLIDAIDGLTAGSGSGDSVQTIVLERPQTLRSALNAYLYKSINQRRRQTKTYYKF